MVRNILAVAIGYVTIFIFIFVTFSLLYLMLGPANTFSPGSFDVTNTWIVPSLVLSVIAAVAGGFLCSKIAIDSRAVLWLSAVVFVLGVLIALPELLSTPPTNVRDNDLSNMEAMMQARQPLWIAFLNPIIGAAGVLVGGRFGKK